MTSALATGPLPALIDYYERMPDAPPFGFSMEKISFAVVLERSGALAKVGLVDVRKKNDRGKPLHELMLVPDGGGRPGTGITPFFCWDNTGYALGRDNKGDAARAKKMFAAFRDLHLEMRKEVGDDPGFAALCKFLEKWDPADAESLPDWEEAAGKNVVFTLRGHEGYVHQSKAVKAAWLRRVERELAEDEGERGMSLTSGEEELLARTHPMLSGVAGANAMGAAIVSFNFDSATSYGREQSYNSPVGIRDAFRYTTALNRLLADGTRRVQIGDATVVFWAGRPEGKPAEDDFRAIFGGAAATQPEPGESALATARVQASLKSTRRGLPGDDVPGDTPFYILGLSPNASRLNVRYWLADTVAQFRERIRRHTSDLEIVGAREGDPRLSVRRLLVETAREPKDIPPNLAGEVLRCVLSGLPYPRSLLSAVLRRIRADAGVNHARAAILKAFLIRNLNQEVPVALDAERRDQSYVLGRLFAQLERVQEESHQKENQEWRSVRRTIRHTHLSSASSTPASVFPSLLDVAEHHLDKIKAEFKPRPAADGSPRKGKGDYLSEGRGSIVHHLSHLPSALAADQQALFVIGYHHQRQSFFPGQDRVQAQHDVDARDTNSGDSVNAP